MAIRFGNCILDTDARTLFRGTTEVHLSPKAFELLTVLLERRPGAVSKAELLERVWPGVFVSDASLAKTVSKMREAIGDVGDPPIVRTVHGYGYAFAAAVGDDAAGTRSAGTRGQPVCWLFCGNREFPLADGEHIVGRDSNATIRLDSPQVSRRHARVVVGGKSVTLEDLGSKNGSFVSGIRISAPILLEPDAEIRIGPFTLIFRAADSESTLSEVRSPSAR
jgi:DNA-binding winged helix-turn-helix (wHTH) protein